MQISKRKYPSSMTDSKWGVINFYEWCKYTIGELNKDREFVFYLDKLPNRKICISRDKRTHTEEGIMLCPACTKACCPFVMPRDKSLSHWFCASCGIAYPMEDDEIKAMTDFMEEDSIEQK